jgi:exonuclease V gamma subunit
MDLLKNWGSLFEGFDKLISSPSFERNVVIGGTFFNNSQETALSTLQYCLMNNQNPEEPFHVPVGDKSLSIVSTSGKWREVEALKNRILRLLDQDDSLELTDIGVLAPDINEYSYYIEAVFPANDKYNLPYNIIDLKGDEDSPFISAFLCLLNLTGSRFTRKDLFSLFSNRCFAERNGISSGEYDTWLQVCSSVNIKWAVDEEQKNELNIEGSRYNTWESGFDRILEGMALSEVEDPAAAPFELFNESSNHSVGKLIHIIRSLNSDINSLTGVKLQLEEWILVWESIMETYLKPSEAHPVDSKDRLRVKGCFRDILNMLNDLNHLDDLENRGFDFFMFKSLITEFINKSGGSRGRYLTQGISCSSLKPLRAVPFKVILLLGLNEEVFPVSEEPLSFDLKETSYVKNIISIDLSRRSSDKYSFLEVFLSAREKVILFYTGRNNIDNEALQPSPIINELAEYLDKYFVSSEGGEYFKSIFEEEKLQPFDKEYFSRDSVLFSYSEKDFKLSEIYYNRNKTGDEVSGFDRIPLKTEESILEITYNDLNKFLLNPLKYFFNSTMGIYMEEAELLEEDIYENVELDFFERRNFFRDIVFSESLNEDTLHSIKERIEDFCLFQNRRGELINNELSIPDIERISDTAKKIVLNLMNDTELSSKPEPTIFSFGEKEDRDRKILKSPILIFDSGLSVKITGSLPPLYIYPDKTISFLNIISKTSPSTAHWMTPFLLNQLIPPEIRGNQGVKAHLVSPQKVFSTQFSQVENSSLEQIVRTFILNLEKPVPLYPELAELLNDKKSRGTRRNPEDLKSLFIDKWIEKDETESFGYSEFKSCPYRFKAYKGLPDVSGEDLTGLYDSLYGELFDDLNKEKGV